MPTPALTPSTTSPPASSPTGPAGARRRSGRLSGPSGLALLLVLLVLVSLASLAIGSRAIAPDRVLDLLLHPAARAGAGPDWLVVRDLRVPRTLLGLAVGVALGVAGALMQGHTRNPLADPGLLGVTAGASFAVVLAVYGLGVSSALGYTWFALAGAGLASAAVFAIGSGRGGPDPLSLVLAGTAVSALLASLTQALVLNDTDTLDTYRFWVVGSVDGPGLGVLVRVGPFLLAGLLLAAVGVRGLDLLQLGDDVARSLGVSPVRQRVLGIVAIMLLAGGATAACGPIGFLGLVVPHLARALAGTDHRWVLPSAGMLGAILLVGADVVGRVVARPAEVQVGIVLAVLGGPVFVLLARRTRSVSR